MAFRKYARVERLVRLAFNADGSIAPVEATQHRSAFLDPAYRIDIGAVLEKHANQYRISRDPKDYLFEVVRACTADAPNENGDAFRRAELLRFSTKVGMPVYQTFRTKPHHMHHQASDPTKAKGIIVDAHYNDDTPTLEHCPTCNARTADREQRDETGLLCKCGTVVKDEFVDILLAIDASKDPHLARGIRNGEFTATSMGCDCQETVCNVCGHVARSAAQFCRHIKGSAKRTFWMKTASSGDDFFKVSAAEADRLLASRGAKLNPTGFRSAKVADLEIRRAIEDCYGVEFQEQSRVGHPADPKALQRAILRAQAAVARGDTSEPAAARALERRRTALMKTAQMSGEPRQFVVIRVEGDPADTYAAETAEKAIELAMPDEGSVVEMGEVTASDPGAARLQDPPDGWRKIDPKDFGYDASAFSAEADVELTVPENAHVEVSTPASEAAPAATPAPAAQPAVEAPGAPDAPIDDQVTPEEMGIMPPPAFGRAYSRIYADIHPDSRVVLSDLDYGPLLTFKAAQKFASRDERMAYGMELVASILNEGYASALKGLKVTASARVAQIANSDSMDDRAEGRETMKSSIAKDPQPDRIETPAADAESMVMDSDSDDDRSEDREGPSEDSLAAKPEVDRTDAPSGEGGSVGGEPAETDRGDRPGADIKRDDMTSRPMLDRAAAVERRLKAIHARELAELRAEFETRESAMRKASLAQVERVLRIIDTRIAKNLEQATPLKAAMFEALTTERQVGRDSRTGEALVYQPMEEDLATHLIEAAWAEASSEESEYRAQRLAELINYDDTYLVSAESDLAKAAVYLPSITTASEMQTRSAESEAFRRSALQGNFQWTPETTVEDPAYSGNEGLRALIRGMGRPQHRTNRQGNN